MDWWTWFRGIIWECIWWGVSWRGGRSFQGGKPAEKTRLFTLFRYCHWKLQLVVQDDGVADVSKEVVVLSQVWGLLGGGEAVYWRLQDDHISEVRMICLPSFELRPRDGRQIILTSPRFGRRLVPVSKELSSLRWRMWISLYSFLFTRLFTSSKALSLTFPSSSDCLIEFSTFKIQPWIPYVLA